MPHTELQTHTYARTQIAYHIVSTIFRVILISSQAFVYISRKKKKIVLLCTFLFSCVCSSSSSRMRVNVWRTLEQSMSKTLFLIDSDPGFITQCTHTDKSNFRSFPAIWRRNREEKKIKTKWNSLLLRICCTVCGVLFRNLFCFVYFFSGFSIFQKPCTAQIIRTKE